MNDTSFNTSNDTKLSEDNKAMMLARSRMKSKAVAYLLLLFVGLLGIHRFYIEEKKTARRQLGLFILIIFSLIGVIIGLSLKSTGISVFFTYATMMLAMFMVVWWLVDLFLTNKLVDNYNIKLIRNAINHTDNKS